MKERVQLLQAAPVFSLFHLLAEKICGNLRYPHVLVARRVRASAGDEHDRAAHVACRNYRQCEQRRKPAAVKRRKLAAVAAPHKAAPRKRKLLKLWGYAALERFLFADARRGNAAVAVADDD